MKKRVKRYIQNCHTCQRAKALTDWYNELLKLLLIFSWPWTDFTLDFVTDLAMSNNYNIIIMVVDCLTKERSYIACMTDENGITTQATPPFWHQNVEKLHGLPLSATFDRGPHFISRVRKNICTIFGILSADIHHFIQRQIDKVELSIKKWKNNFVPLFIINKIICQTNYLWQSL